MIKDDFYKYGWLDPSGNFYEVDWGDHTNFAMDYVNQHKYLLEEFEECYNIYTSEADFLIHKGWILLHNPEYGLAIVTRHAIRHVSRKQKDFLFDYYSQRGQIEIAEEYL